MALALLYKYINCTVNKLLALALVTNYITNYSIRKQQQQQQQYNNNNNNNNDNNNNNNILKTDY